jgi:hypothetical protein
VAAVGGIAQLGQARRAGRRVGGHRRGRLAAARAAEDPELLLAGRRQRGPCDGLDRGQRRRLGRQAGDEALDRLGRPLDVDEHAALVVAHEAAEALLAGDPVDVRPEADALHGPLDAAGRAPRHRSTSSRSTW